MSLLKEAFEAGKFGVTAEMAPPKGWDFSHQLADAELLIHVLILQVIQIPFQTKCETAAQGGALFRSPARGTSRNSVTNSR